MVSRLERGYIPSADDEPGTPGSGGVGVGLGWPHLSPYATLARHQPRDPQALCLNSYMDEQEALEACQEEVTAMSKRSIKKCDKQAMANRLVLLVLLLLVVMYCCCRCLLTLFPSIAAIP